MYDQITNPHISAGAVIRNHRHRTSQQRAFVACVVACAAIAVGFAGFATIIA